MSYLLRFFLSILLLTGISTAAWAQAGVTETSAEFAYMVDFNSGALLLDRRGEEKMGPSSMTKLMTTYLLFEKLQKGELKLTDTFPVSEEAWKKGGSKMFVKLGSDVSIEDLIRGIVIQSGNDACIVVAEGIAGSEEAFATLMNQKAEELGLKQSHFVNSTGWPDPGHVMSSKDLAILSAHLIRDFPEYYHYFKEPAYIYNGITQYNRNLLIDDELGVDGLKTGHTEAAGYGITLSAREPETGHQLILVVNGLDSVKSRETEGARLLKWAFNEFDTQTPLKQGDIVGEAPVWYGMDENVPLMLEKNAVITVPSLKVDDIKYTVVYDSPIPAPIKKGQLIAKLRIKPPRIIATEFPLVAANDVDKVTGFSKAWHNVRALVSGESRTIANE